MAESIAQERLELTFLIQKLDSRISKYQQIALNFAACILVAISLILGCIDLVPVDSLGRRGAISEMPTKDGASIYLEGQESGGESHFHPQQSGKGGLGGGAG